VNIDRSRYLTMQEAADKSGYDYDHIRRLVREGKVRTLPIDKRTRLIDWDDLQQYMQEKPQRKPHHDKKLRGD
jgi:excisionase family DNA binding protein